MDQRNFYCMQPDREEVLLPVAFKREVYQQYCGEQTKKSFDVSDEWLKVTEQYFNRVWKLDVPTLKCRKYHRFQMCDVCMALNKKLRITSLSDIERRAYAKAKDEHLCVVREDRYGYEMRILQAKEYPEELMNITINGSDNGQCGFPYWAIKTKETDKGYKLKTKLYAALVHGHGVYAYIYNAHLEGGTNVTVNVLHHTLTKLQEEGKKFPAVLCLQLDNTVKENKSKYVLAYLQALVDLGLFKEVNVFFFQVGHTHCDIDQLFSRVSIYLKDKHIFTFEDLCNAVKEALGGWSFVKFKHAVKLEFFANWRDTIDSMFISSHKLEGITRFRYFRLRIVTDENGASNHELMVKRSIYEEGNFYNFSFKHNTHQVLLENDFTFTPDFFVNTSLWKDYLVQPMREEDLQKFSKSLSVCLPRMQRTLQSREKGEDAFNLLSREIEMMKTGAVFAYNWNTTIYTNSVLHL